MAAQADQEAMAKSAALGKDQVEKHSQAAYLLNLLYLWSGPMLLTTMLWAEALWAEALWEEMAQAAAEETAETGDVAAAALMASILRWEEELLALVRR
jgi:hypothetical protein